MRNKLFARALLAGIVSLSACADAGIAPLSPDGSGGVLLAKGGVAGQYVVLGANGQLPADFAAQAAAAGATVETLHAELGVAIVNGSPSAAGQVAGLAGVESVAQDLVVQWTDPVGEGLEVAIDGAEVINAAAGSIGDDETFYSFQWAPASIDAPAAWSAGFQGQGVRVAVIDGGIYSSHLDLDGNLDVAASRSFYPGTLWNQDVGTFWHGTHVAGIVAAEDNGIGTVGIAPKATIVGVKALHNGSGPFSAILNAIMYAATPLAEGGAGAHVINMSLGAQLDDKDQEQKKAVKELKKAVDRATRFAHQQGVVVIASSGNGATNFDDNKELLKTPAQNANVVSISSTGPVGWARGATNYSQLAYYSDHGKSLVTLSAPGGNFALAAVNGDFGLCTVTGTFLAITNPCYAFDGVMSTVRGGATATASYNWSQGTSMAAPAASGVAALVIQKLGVGASPASVEAVLRQSASDLGKPGHDEFHGHGWINAARAVGIN